MKHLNRLLPVFILFAVFLALQSCSDNNRNPFINRFEPKAAPPPYDSTQAVQDSTLGGGLKIYVIKKGDDTFRVSPNDAIQVRYTARRADGKIFQTTYHKNGLNGNTKVLYNLYPYPSGQVSPLQKGFRKGLLGMKEGEERIIRVPPSMGYTSSNASINGVNVSNKTLIYDVELLQIAP
jgi:FKBP-type peptidyl-prolyl cis-trans isomerase